MRIRVLHSFPHKIGAGRICTTAWQEVAGVAAAGGEVTVFPGAVARPLPASVRVQPTLARGRWRIPYKPLGDRALMLHDRIVAHRLPKLQGQIDIVHAWPLGSLETLRSARRLGIPTVLERPNAHTRFAYEVVARECDRLGVSLPRSQEHAYNAARLAQEEREYRYVDCLLCPSEFVADTFRDAGFPDTALVRHQYGFDESVYYPSDRDVTATRGLNALFVGVCAVRKGVHFALDAWLRSPASRTGKFRIAGQFIPQYEAKLAEMLAHPSVEVLGHSDHVPALMRDSDVLMLPSIEEGSPLVCAEAMASGCVPLVSEVCTEMVTNGETGLKHGVGDVDLLSAQITKLDEDRTQLSKLRRAGLVAAADYTWSKAGARLLTAYRDVISQLSSAAALVA
ncbi:MAG: glycosyltransferase family 4 protein [Solirubrobacterales bacterium]|nr:glycosyltransferase family 4 protein [Solirubrobacterales bacterium]